jgi:hypothetical protein
MVLIHESPSSKHSYPKQALWIYFIPSNPFLLVPLISVSVDFFLFLCFQDDLEYHCVLVSQEPFVGYDQTITNDVGSASFEFVLPQVCPVYHHFWFDLSLCRLSFKNFMGLNWVKILTMPLPISFLLFQYILYPINIAPVNYGHCC